MCAEQVGDNHPPKEEIRMNDNEKQKVYAAKRAVFVPTGADGKPSKTRRTFMEQAQSLADTAGPLETIVVASVNLHRGTAIRLSSNPTGPALAVLARSLLVEALDMMAEADDGASMAYADAMEAAIACLPDPDMDEENDHA